MHEKARIGSMGVSEQPAVMVKQGVIAGVLAMRAKANKRPMCVITVAADCRETAE